MFKGDIYIYGAKSTAIGLIRAVKKLYNSNILGCIVSSLDGNPETVEGIQVQEVKSFSEQLNDEEKKAITIIIATPVYVQAEIRGTLRQFGFEKIYGLDTGTEEKIMREYFESENIFPSIKVLSQNSNKNTKLDVEVFQVNHIKDMRLRGLYVQDSWVKQIQAGASVSDSKICELTDDTGENISEKNPLYCELTVLYWMWKNKVSVGKDNHYLGLYQYRRVLDLDERDLATIADGNVDVVLPYPMIHVPNIKEHHERYTNEPEWQAMLEAVKELYPEYYEKYEEIFSGQYMYNYNMFVCRDDVLNDYCKWLFDILFRAEEICNDKVENPAKRYLAYFGESLLTWYFLYNKDKYKIYHTGRLLRE